jgi:hypothetical protein
VRAVYSPTSERRDMLTMRYMNVRIAVIRAAAGPGSQFHLNCAIALLDHSAELAAPQGTAQLPIRNRPTRYPTCAWSDTLDSPSRSALSRSGRTLSGLDPMLNVSSTARNTPH